MKITTRFTARNRLIFLAFGFILMLSSAIAPALAESTEVSIEKARYIASKSQLRVNVSIENPARKTVYLYDDDSDELLARKRTTKTEFTFRIKDLSGDDVPCAVRVEFEGRSTKKM